MPTFVLKKYNDKPTPAPTTVDGKPVDPPEPSTHAEDEVEELKISVTGSISGIVAQALYKAFKTTEIQVEVEEKEGEDADATVQVISAEDINLRPSDVLKRAKQAKFLFISSEGFKTLHESWFLHNVEAANVPTVYTVESLVQHVKAHFK